MIDKIRSRYPNDLFCAEEGDLKTPVDQGSVWVIDPIDGTNNFVAQAEDFAIMVAYFENGQGQFGIIYDVMKDVCYHGGGVFPAYCNNQLLSPFKAKPLSDFLVAINAGMLETNAWGVTDLGECFTWSKSLWKCCYQLLEKFLSGQAVDLILLICNLGIMQLQVSWGKISDIK